MNSNSSISRNPTTNTPTNDLRVVSDAVISTVNHLKRSGVNLLRKVPDLYYDPADGRNDGLFSSRLITMMRAKRDTTTDGGSAYSTSCTSASQATESNSSISTHTSMMVATGPTRSCATPTTTAAAIAEPTTSQTMGQPIIMINKDKKGQHKEVVFEAATNFRSARMVAVNDDGTNEDKKEEPVDDTDDDDDDDDDETNSMGQFSGRTRRLSLMLDEAQAVARRGKNMDLGRILHKNGQSYSHTFQLPVGVTRDDILVTIDIDDTARSSIELTENEGLDEQVMPHRRCNTYTISKTKSGRTSSQQESHDCSTNNFSRRAFEQAVEHVILEDLKSIYPATPDTAKLVLCIVICILSDGSLQHTSRVGGRVGLCELALNWRLFGADDLKVYQGGLTVQRKDFGFGPLELTEAEGEYYLVSHMAPRAANDIVRRIGGAHQDFLAEI
jgi:hypothetical protein